MWEDLLIITALSAGDADGPWAPCLHQCPPAATSSQIWRSAYGGPQPASLRQSTAEPGTISAPYWLHFQPRHGSWYRPSDQAVE